MYIEYEIFMLCALLYMYIVSMYVTYFQTEEEKHFCLVFLGRDWGENGYIRYSYTDARCGLEKLAYTFTI